MSTIEALEAYYARSGILSTEFSCHHRMECSHDSPEFTGPKSAFVSTGFESTRPRLLFLSLDSGSGSVVPENRLPSYISQYEQFDRDFTSLAKHKHWYRTHELAWYILKRFHKDLKLPEARNYFAHANSAKCCMNKPQRKKADAILFRNCRGYLREELSILQPNILVTQGREARTAVEELPKLSSKDIAPFVKEIVTDSWRAIWFHTYHPSNWGRFNGQRRFNRESGIAVGWTEFAELAHGYLNGPNE